MDQLYDMKQSNSFYHTNVTIYILKCLKNKNKSYCLGNENLTVSEVLPSSEKKGKSSLFKCFRYGINHRLPRFKIHRKIEGFYWYAAYIAHPAVKG